MLNKINSKTTKKKLLQNLHTKGIETRPIISGNFLNQKASKAYNLKIKNQKFLMQIISIKQDFLLVFTQRYKIKNIENTF